MIFDLLMKLHVMVGVGGKRRGTGGGYISLSNRVMLIAMKKTDMCRSRPGIEECDTKEAAGCNTHLRNHIPV